MAALSAATAGAVFFASWTWKPGVFVRQKIRHWYSHYGLTVNWQRKTVGLLSSPCKTEMVLRLIAHHLWSNCAVMRGKRNISAGGNSNLQGYLPIEKNTCKTFTLAKNTRRNAKPRNFWPHGRKNFCPFWLLFGQSKSDIKKNSSVNLFSISYLNLWKVLSVSFSSLSFIFIGLAECFAVACPKKGPKKRHVNPNAPLDLRGQRHCSTLKLFNWS